MSYKITFAIFLCCLFILSLNLSAKDKLIHYSSGAFTSKNSQVVKTIDCKSNRNYKVIVGVVNYTKSMLSLSLRENGEDFKTVLLDGLKGKKEIINFSTLKSELFSLEIKADFIDASFKFASFDILIVEED
ncbi:hypothetical protein L0Z72_09210 [candidate division KSB1 bacterium]|nr:hypothetical protein [candidate division KSB1 bacterium]